MNRNQRRRIVREGLSTEDVKQIEKEAVQQAIDKTQTLYIVAASFVLHDKWGFGHKRLSRFLEQLQTLLKDIADERLSFDDCIEVIDKECGLKFIEEPRK